MFFCTWPQTNNQSLIKPVSTPSAVTKAQHHDCAHAPVVFAKRVSLDGQHVVLSVAPPSFATSVKKKKFCAASVINICVLSATFLSEYRRRNSNLVVRRQNRCNSSRVLPETPPDCQRFSAPSAANKVALANWSGRDPPSIAGWCATFGLRCRVPSSWLELGPSSESLWFGRSCPLERTTRGVDRCLVACTARAQTLCVSTPEAVVGTSTSSLLMASISRRCPRCPYLGSRGVLPQSLTTRRQHRCSPACTCAADSARRQRSKLPHQLIHDVRPVARVSRQALPSRFRSCVSHRAPATSYSLGGNSEQRRRPPPPRTPQPSERRFSGELLAESFVEGTRSTVTRCPSRLCPVTFFPCDRLPHLTLPELDTQFSCFKNVCTPGVQEASFLFSLLLQGLRHVRHALASAAAFLPVSR